ncbi:hypothetical protein HDF26_003241 [Pedobacter cryoconitis]|uniref:Uncharacterized protein n=1 Tax=Pedobacter cryoconitis TaxID=188932 RepID=A0A7W8ZM35_9SPHI|nr:hypothetical protein [Pedobacter cryoconitis]MBB5636302.1 hypothetical protein [Pedobacter cryoconitis]MBB6272781.1 hypothetical protein [Pedobacter cryoconitis]
MEQYIYEDEYRGQKRKLLILSVEDGSGYRVFLEAKFIGLITPVVNEETLSWQTDYNILKPIVKKIGEWIEKSN